MNTTTTTKEAKSPTRPVFITVNRKQVKIDGPKASGLEIKVAAIEQGVAIERDFQLAMVDAEGKQKIIGDEDIVEVTDKSTFFATAPDDNS